MPSSRDFFCTIHCQVSRAVMLSMTISVNSEAATRMAIPTTLVCQNMAHRPRISTRSSQWATSIMARKGPEYSVCTPRTSS